MNPDSVKESCQDIFSRYGAEGAELFRARHPGKAMAMPSHVCVKFTDADAYAACKNAASGWGALSVRPYQGREITWCRLREPLMCGETAMHWLELAEPADEPNAFNGVTAIVYSVAELGRVEKIQPAEESLFLFRYQKFSAEKLAA
jgi:hypothetical protein